MANTMTEFERVSRAENELRAALAQIAAQYGIMWTPETHTIIVQGVTLLVGTGNINASVIQGWGPPNAQKP